MICIQVNVQVNHYTQFTSKFKMTEKGQRLCYEVKAAINIICVSILESILLNLLDLLKDFFSLTVSIALKGIKKSHYNKYIDTHLEFN